MFYFYYDWTYILVLIGALICIAASARVNSVFSRYSRVRSHSGLTGREAAEQILHRNGIYDVQVIHIAGNLTDHYNPRNKTLGLSDTVYNSASVAAIGVAAHECGHAVQHSVGYAPLSIRGALVPVANFGSMAAWPLIIIGLFMNGQTAALFINLGILLFSAAVLFIRDALSRRSGIRKESAWSCSSYLCGQCCFHDPAASASAYPDRRKKKE